MQADIQIIYVHGFGGHDCAPPFFIKLNDSFRKMKLQCNLSTFYWDSKYVSAKSVCADFLEAEINAATAGNKLNNKISEIEEKKSPYCLIGFSLGALVISQALLSTRVPLNTLKGIFYLGAAIDCNMTLPETIIPQNARCHNYHSMHFDKTLGVLYKNVKGVDAAGKVGLNHTAFTNLSVNCSHHLLKRLNYENLAEPIANLIAWDNGIIMSNKIKINMPFGTLGGNTHWNNICVHNNKYLVQQNIHTGHYRAILNKKPHTRAAWGFNLHDVLVNITENGE